MFSWISNNYYINITVCLEMKDWIYVPLQCVCPPLSSGDSEPQLSPTGLWCRVRCPIIASEYEGSLQQILSVSPPHLLPMKTLSACVCSACALWVGVCVCCLYVLPTTWALPSRHLLPELLSITSFHPCLCLFIRWVGERLRQCVPTGVCCCPQRCVYVCAHT